MEDAKSVKEKSDAPQPESGEDQNDSPEVEPSEGHSDRKRLSRLVLVFIIIGGLMLGFRFWHGRPVDVEVVHHFPDGDVYLPGDVEVMVWKDDDLYADAFFPNPESLAELTHSIRVPAGTYLVTYSLFESYAVPRVRFQQRLDVQEQGRYYLAYEIPGNDEGPRENP